MFADHEPRARLFVINLFHETTPLFLDETEQRVFYVDQAALAMAPGFKEWIEARFRAIEPNPDTYLARFGAMAEACRSRPPGGPVLLLGRLTHFPFFGPIPIPTRPAGKRSATGRAASGRMGGRTAAHRLPRRGPGVCRVWAGSERAIEAHCPFLRMRREPDGGLATRRDLEHVGSLWDRLAEVIAAFLSTGRLDYGPKGTVPDQWGEPPQAPERLDRERLRGLLRSGANYASGRAVAAFFSDPDTDHTALLAEAAPQMPICHHTLHMVRHYAARRKNPALAPFIAAQRGKIRTFTANGPATSAFTKAAEGDRRDGSGRIRCENSA
jgi:hypothetical protein